MLGTGLLSEAGSPLPHAASDYRCRRRRTELSAWLRGQWEPEAVLLRPTGLCCPEAPAVLLSLRLLVAVSPDRWL